MTTDRTAAPSRSTALADRPTAAGGRTPTPSADTFSLLLGAATPKHDAPVRRDDTPSNQRQDDARADKQRRGDDLRSPQRAGEDKRPVPKPHEDSPAPADAADPADATATDPTAEAKPTAPTAPNIFALQLASPLPPQTAPAAETPAAALPAFAGQVPAAVAAATTAQATATTDVTATVADAATAAATAAAATTAEATTNAAATAPAATDEATAAKGAIALQGLPAEATADATLPAGLDLTKPQAQAPATDAPAASAQDPATQATATQPNPGDGQSQSQPQDQGNAPAQPTAAAAQAKPADAPAPAAAPPQTTSPIAPSAAPAMPSMPTVERSVPLSRAVATTGVMVHMMTDKGVNHARLNLKPAELGGIEVRLRSTPEGLHAHLVADSPEAARMLSSASDDLKRQLEDKNVNLLSLDVSTSDQRQDQPAGFSTDGFGDDRYRPGQNTGRSRAHESTLLMDAPAAADTTLVLPDGVHVDVLA